ncbi:MAG: hypothetical protein C4334_08805, partial [Pyrinomonas sp.]
MLFVHSETRITRAIPSGPISILSVNLRCAKAREFRDHQSRSGEDLVTDHASLVCAGGSGMSDL